MVLKNIGFCAFGLLFINAASSFDGSLLKHLPPPKPGGLLDVLKKPKIPGINIHLSKGQGGFGAGASIGSFGIGFGFGGHYVPPGTAVNLPPGNPHVPDIESHVPDLKPNPVVITPQVPDVKPHPSGVIPEKEKGDKEWPNWEDYEEGPKRDGSLEKDEYPKHDSHESDEIEYPKHDSYEGDNDDTRPAWEDIGEADPNDSDSKSDNFMNGELVNGGLIQPRLNKRRNRRFIESHVYHVPLLFRSNAKPFQVKVQSNPNSLLKEILEK